MNLSLQLARRYIRHPGGRRRFSGLVSVIGVALGVMLLLVVMAVLNGLAGDLKTRITRTESHIRVTGRERMPVTMTPRQAISLAGSVSVAGAARFVQGEILLIHHGRTAGAVLYGVDMTGAGRGDGLRAMLDHSGGCSAGARGLILGTLLAQRIWAVPGDTILIATPKELMPRPGGRPPRLIRRSVECAFTSGLPDFDGTLAFMPVDEAAILLEGQSVPGLELWLHRPDDAPAVARTLRAGLNADTLAVAHWGELNRNLFHALRLEKVAMFLVMALVILIAGFNITGGILRNVVARRVEIAVLMTMGCTPGTVVMVFMLEGVLVGVLGAVAGCGLGVAVATMIGRFGLLSIPGDLMPFDTVPVVLRLGDILWVTMATVAITTVSALYPAFRASRLDPVAILRDL